MKGEKVIAGDDFIKAAKELKNILMPQIAQAKDKFIIAVSGESGSGKTGISVTLSKLFSEQGIKTLVIQQDDYSSYPPSKTVLRRKKSLAGVGISEVQLALLEQNLQEIKMGKKEIIKPLVALAKNSIVKEVISLEDVKVVIIEGIYTFIFEDADKHIFIDRNHEETKEGRELRGRDKQDELMERVLKIEHCIISLGKPKADILITNDFEVKEK
jgi:uridine kinase